ncbi:GalNAc-alpha-(1-_4)-GalNAc-alpha-(1-_3)-diNAcBac-PP-undecaprenol alpha-1,4-N-acetyl-D-galactosaminyltransferase [Roseivivax sp. THAF40]|uniref:glycosyltransferase family 4 protein n=1 Tax=unclassified Roseivivax TaxID=2639302 RepID=UPI0012AA20B9|nr:MULTISPECIES: glycosyltransferase family 4 protein [unclassified Roseivivax]QFS82442.1 GalNAc-alpha-(1->4)-GalNAc-alpha-(1->3)-diNAcBac-PP-undecaprenol alpha-1,4-N-acetyl-D-galactosaminyltransferase [Roseivivax sp. THAF197b]QFT46211.1 GalNAc-alpha-(1->4)-GalNAc-alpha-(1->3)-diNAcBac-PP-undecaprenol alpha-1,4-N-acetyl-D-galactosaminyltransferase [Roseivivax sp. THAF40]
MKVLFVQGGFGAGGAEKIIAMIAANRAEQGDEVHVAGMTMPKDGSFFTYPDAVRLHPMCLEDAAPRRRVQWQRLRHIRRVIKKTKPDVIISFLTKVNTLVLLATLGSSVPVVISERNNPKAQNANPIWDRAQSLLGRRATSIAMQTERAREDLPSGLQSRAVVIPNPCAPLAPSKARPGIGANLVAVGRLDRQKGFDMLLEAMPSIRDTVPEARLTIFGEGRERAALEAQRQRLGIADCVFLPGASLPGQWIEGQDMLVVSSRFEGFPNVIAEAVVSGLPVVSFDCDYGPQELIRHGENGFLVPQDDIEGFARSVTDVARDPDLRAAISKAAGPTREWLAPARILREWDRVIDGVTASRTVSRQADRPASAASSSSKL